VGRRQVSRVLSLRGVSGGLRADIFRLAIRRTGAIVLSVWAFRSVTSALALAAGALLAAKFSRELKRGNSGVADQLIRLIMTNFHVWHSGGSRAEPNHNTLQTTALAHEAYLKFTSCSPGDLE
jgi:hypothetical protein